MGSNGIKAIVEADRCLQAEGGGRVIVHDAREQIRRLFADRGRWRFFGRRPRELGPFRPEGAPKEAA